MTGSTAAPAPTRWTAGTATTRSTRDTASRATTRSRATGTDSCRPTGPRPPLRPRVRCAWRAGDALSSVRGCCAPRPVAEARAAGRHRAPRSLSCLSMPTDPWVAAAAPAIAERAERELEALVGVSSPSGDVRGAEEAVAIVSAVLPTPVGRERIACSTPGHAPDLLARLRGDGALRLLLLGHLDTVIAHEAHT